ncbi:MULTISPECIES: dihydrodipicolinate synthase family protein [unclassified Nonomuraea]|uniref:dihydrodipicolinate synthase family protein n=1 Tax=unclassified Nonomuraea TaxID=2593643 RepID=UPI0033CB98F9
MSADFAIQLASVCAVVVTPMATDGSIDLDSVRRLARHVDGGRSGTITVGGSVGEFLALTAQERLDVVAATVETVGKPVIASVGGAVDAAIQEAKAAAAYGAAAVMIHQPTNPFASVAGWVAYHRAIASAISPLPVVLYLRDPAVGPPAVAELVAACPNVVGIKHSVPDPTALAAHAVLDQVVWLCGLAEKWAAYAWQAGATGFTSGLIAVDDTIPMALYDALRTGDLAASRAAVRRATAFENLRSARGGAPSVGVVKTALAQLGVIASATVRPPLEPLPPAETEQVAAMNLG